jgi:hypothetical protein
MKIDNSSFDTDSAALLRNAVSDFVLVQSLTATLGTLDYFSSFHYVSPPNMESSQS